MYPEAVIARVQLIQHLYAAGLASAAVADILPCVHTGVPTTAQLQLLVAERDRLDRRVEDLVATRDRLDAVITTATDAATPCLALCPAPRLAPHT